MKLTIGVAVIALIGIGALGAIRLDQTAQTKADYEMREKCGEAASRWFKDHFGTEKNSEFLTVAASYQNHYNKKLNSCFIVVDAFTSMMSGKDSMSWTSDEVVDINENKTYGSYEEFTTNKTPSACTTSGHTCKSKDEWNSLVLPYMNE